jgi:hypothetical protein
MPSNKPTELDSMNRLRVEAERRATQFKELLQSAMPWLEMHRETEARELGRQVREALRAPGVPGMDGGQSNG